jgi:hypothetical protein
MVECDEVGLDCFRLPVHRSGYVLRGEFVLHEVISQLQYLLPQIFQPLMVLANNLCQQGLVGFVLFPQSRQFCLKALDLLLDLCGEKILRDFEQVFRRHNP